MKMSRMISDESVIYTDNAVFRNLLFDKTPIHLTNDVDLGKSLATLGDLMQEIKAKAIRKEYFNINHIIQWGMERHNLQKKKNYITRAREYSASYYSLLKKDKRFIPIKMINNKKHLCLEEWQHNRSIFIDRIEKHKNVRDNVFSYWSSPRSFFYFFDYFFINMQDYKDDRRFLEISFKQCKKILESRPSKDEKLYVMHRILKNGKASNYLRDFLRGATEVQKNKNKDIDIRLYKPKMNIYFQFNTAYYGNDCVARQKKENFWVLSLNQIKAIVWIRENYNQLFRGRTLHKRETTISFAIETLKYFLKNPSAYTDCEYIENKTYRSLWL